MKTAAWLLPLCLWTQGAAYKDARFGFSIEPPAFAAAEAASVTPVMFFAAPENGFAANLNVSVQTTPMTAKEYAELEWPIDLAIAVVWLVFAVNFFRTLARRRERHL